MSGEGGGAIVGGIIAIAVAPYIIAGAAALGLAYGAIKVGGFLLEEAVDYAAEKKREKELVVDRCSTELEGLFSDMRKVVREETAAHTEYVKEMSEKFEKYGTELKTSCEGKTDVEFIDKKIAVSRDSIKVGLKEESAAMRGKIVAEGQERFKKCVKVIEESNAEKAALVDWADTRETQIAMQKNVAVQMVRDAEAAFRVLESMAKSSKDSSFTAQVKHIEAALSNARSMMDQEMYQSAFANAKTVVRESAMLASEHVQNELEMDMLAMELKAKIKGLVEELNTQRYMEFCDETTARKKNVRVDLNHFSQGKYEKMLEQLQEMEAEVDKKATVYELEKIAEQLEDETEPEARRIVDCSIKVMQAYYDKVHALEVIADFMTEQDYQMDWVMPVGGDRSQKIVVHFVQNGTGNSVSITLDKDVHADEVAGMAMEILTFYGNGRTVTEEEKKRLREHLNKALTDAGYSGELKCTGNRDKASDRVEMNSKEGVQNMETTEVV